MGMDAEGARSWAVPMRRQSLADLREWPDLDVPGLREGSEAGIAEGRMKKEAFRRKMDISGNFNAARGAVRYCERSEFFSVSYRAKPLN